MASYTINLILDGKSNIQSILAKAGQDIETFVKKAKGTESAAPTGKGWEKESAAINKATADVDKYARQIEVLSSKITNIKTPDLSASTKKMGAETEANLKRMENNWTAYWNRVYTISAGGAKKTDETLKTIGSNTTFQNLSNKFDATMRQIQSSAQATVSSVSGYFNKLDSGVGSLGAMVGGGYTANELFNYGQLKATSQQMLSNMGKSSFYDPYLQFTMKSSTSDQDINRMFQYISTAPNLQQNQVYAALNAVDAAAMNADPVQKYRDQMAWGSYMQGGWDQAGMMLRDEGLTDDQKAMLQAAETPEERIAAINEIARAKGKVDEFGNSISTTTTGPMANYNKALTAIDTLMRGMASGFDKALGAIIPVVDVFNSLSPEAQTVVGELVFFGAALVTGTAALKILSTITPDFLKDKIGKLLGTTSTAKMDVDAAVVNVNGKSTTTPPGSTTPVPLSTRLMNYANKLGGPLSILGGGLLGAGATVAAVGSGVVGGIYGGLQAGYGVLSGQVKPFEGQGSVYQGPWDIFGEGTKEPIADYSGGIRNWLGGLFGMDTANAAQDPNAPKSQTRLEKMWDDLKLPTAGDILKTIQEDLNIPKFKIPTLDDIMNWIEKQIPKINWKIPTLQDILNWIKNQIPRINWSIPSLTDIGSYIKGKIDWLSWSIPSWQQIYDAIVKMIPPFPWPSGPGGAVGAVVRGARSAYTAAINAANNPVGTATNIVTRVGEAIVDPIGTAKKTWNWLTGSSGPGNKFDGMNFQYENYPGTMGGIGVDGNTISGNCVDLSLALIAAAGEGHLVPSTWNGNPHVYARIGNRDYDPANKALTNNFNPASRGPGKSKEVYIDLRGAKIYDGPSFNKTIRGIMDEYTGEILKY